MTAITLELNDVDARERHPLIPTITHPSALFRDYVATRRELQAADARAASIDDFEDGRKAEEAAREVWDRMLDFAYVIKDRKIESEQDLRSLSRTVTTECPRTDRPIGSSWFRHF